MPSTAQTDIVDRLRDIRENRRLVRELAAKEITRLNRTLGELERLTPLTDTKPAPIPRKRKKAPKFPRGTPAKERLMAMVEVDPGSGCWIWLGSGGTHYGYIRDDKGRGVPAHRLSYTLHTGYRFKKGEFALHACDNTWCVNPDHLRPGTCADNHEDQVRKGRHHTAKLTLEQAQLIRRRYDDGETGPVLAKEFGITISAVSRIILGKSWAYDKDSPKAKSGGKRPKFWERLSSLTPDDVRDIRKRSKRGETQSSIAAIYNITQTTVSAIVRRRRWASVR